MRLTKLAMILVLSWCGRNNNGNNAAIIEKNSINQFDLTIIDHNYSMAYGMKYIITNTELKILFVGELEGERDSLLFLTDLKPNKDLKTLADLNLDHLKDHYENPYIDDGSQISIELKKNNKTKKIHLSNYYHKDIGEAIEVINNLIPNQYQISYDKDQF